MILLVIIICILLAAFAGVLLVGAPYLPTLNRQVDAALTLSGITKGERLLELGCGDGKVLLAAAKLGATGIGYELNPFLVVIARLRTWRYRAQIKIIWGDYWRATWPTTEVIFVFLLPKYMKKLDTKIVQEAHKPVRLVSFAFTVPDRKVSAQKDGVYRYNYS